MKKNKYYYIRVKEYIKDDFKDGFYDMGYFSEVEVFFDDKITIAINSVCDKKVATRYKYKAWAEKKKLEIINMTKELEYYYPYEDNIYKYQFEIVEE
jgi:hypothetical protein